MRTLKRLAALVALTGVMATAVVGLAPPAGAAGNGIEAGTFAYVVETDPWLDDVCNNNLEKPEFVVLNIGNGHIDDVGRLDTIAQDCRANGVKTLGYIHGVDSLDYDGDSNTTELRPRVGGSGGIALGTDLEFWINPVSNTERHNASKYLDGIFIDQVPNTCGTASANVNWLADITDAVQDKFTFWGYGNALVMANVGTAVPDCMPGYALAPYNVDMPDRYVSFEGTYATYAGSYLGGNVYNGGGYYNGENTFGQNKFVHIVYDADATEMADAAHLADDRGAAFIAATDDSGGNPFDAAPTYSAPTLERRVATPHMIFDEGNDGIKVAYSSGTPYLVEFPLDDGAGGDSTFVTRFIDAVQTECYVDIEAGTSGTPGDAGEVGSGTDVKNNSGASYGWAMSSSAMNSGFVNCVLEMIQPGANPNDPALTICNDVVTSTTYTDYDCRNPDGSDDVADSNVNAAASAYVQSLLNTSAKVENFLLLIRDRNVENANNGSGGVNCLNVALKRCLAPQNPPLGQYREPYVIMGQYGNSTVQTLSGGYDFMYDVYSLGIYGNP